MQQELAKEYGVSISKVEQIEKVFLPMIATLHEYEEEYNGVIEEAQAGITDDVCKKAKKLRLTIKTVRVNVEKARVNEKQEFLRAGKAIDGIANLHKYAISDKEEKLKAIEDYYENLEIERLKQVNVNRQAAVSVYGVNAEHLDLSDMEPDVWENYLAGCKNAYEQKIAAEAKAEEERLAKEKAQAEENERIRLENERLKSEAEIERKKQEAEAAERKRIEDERIAKEKAEQAERDEALRIEREAAAKKQAEAEAKLAAERAERKRIEDDKRKQEEEIQRAKEAAEAAERKAKEELEQADDRQKIAVFVQALRDLYKTIPKLNDKALEKAIQDKITEISRLCL
jgi:hypothetical protein